MTQTTVDPANWHEHGSGCWLFQQGADAHGWVFGLRWLPTAGQKSRKLLLRQLYREQIRWWNSPTTKASTVGFLPPDAQGIRASSSLRSAASRFAQSHAQGSHLLRLRLASQRYWLVAVHQGNVLCQTDCWLESRQRAEQMEAELHERFGQLQVRHLDWDSEDDRASLCVILNGSDNHVSVTLRRLRPGAPRGLLVWPLVIAVCLVLWWWLSNGVGSAEHPAHTDSTVQVATPLQVWVTSPEALFVVAQTWARLPVNARGWELRTVRCTLDQDNARCQAGYFRVDRGAVNDDLRAVVDETWLMQPVSLDHTELGEQVPLPRARLLKAGSQSNAADWLPSLQKLSSRVFHVDVGAPRSNGLRSLEITLPLDRLDQVQALALPVRWRQMTLEVLPESSWLSMGTRLQVFLSGELTGDY